VKPGERKPIEEWFSGSFTIVRKLCEGLMAKGSRTFEPHVARAVRQFRVVRFGREFDVSVTNGYVG